MARLSGMQANVGEKWFSLTPVRAQPSGHDSEEYLVELYAGGSTGVWSRTFSVADWTSAHIPIWAFARTYVELPKLAATVMPFSLCGTSWGTAPASICDLDWLIASVRPNRLRDRSDGTVAIRLFVREGDDPDLFRRFFIRSELGAAVEFGRDLEREIRDACPAWAKDEFGGPEAGRRW